MKGKDLTGKRFGKLTVLEPTEQRVRDADYSGRSAHALKRVQRMGFAV